MSLPEYAIRRSVTTVMIFLAVVFLGILSVSELPQELFPRINFPEVTVVTDYTNAAPEEIETLITRPLEEAISSVSGLRRLESVSKEGKSTIKVSFNWNQDIDFAALAVREKIDLVKEKLPKEAEDPVVLKFDPLSRPVLILSLTGKLPASELKDIAERTLRDNIEKVEGVASVTISGGLDREVSVELDQGKLHLAEASLLGVIDSLDQANISYPAGSIKKGLYEYLIRTTGEFRDISEIGYTVISAHAKEPSQSQANSFVERGSQGPRESLDTKREGMEQGSIDKRLVLLKDIAEIKDTFSERTTISRYNGKENVSVSIQKQATVNAIELVNNIKITLALLQEELEARGVHTEIVYDHSQFIKKAISNSKGDALQGAILAAIVLLIFLRDIRSSLVIAISLPISVLGAFIFLRLQGITLNTMSLSGMALGIGMIVDNCIVVVENIFRFREQGLSREESSVRGTQEVFWPIVSSTLTTDAVFLPLILFVPGIAGQLFKDLSWAVIHSSNISFLVSVWLIPMLAIYIEPKQAKEKKAPMLQKIVHFFESKKTPEQNKFLGMIVGIGVLCFAAGLLIFRSLDTEIIPKVDQGQFLVKLNMPVGTRLDVTDGAVSTIEEKIKQIPEVENVQVTIGSSTSVRSGEVKIETLRPSQALILVSLKKDRKRPSHAVVHDLQSLIEDADLKRADIEYILQENEFAFAAGSAKPISVEIKGYDLDLLRSLAEEVEKQMKSVDGVTEILDDIGQPSPETKIEIDKRKAALYAISARDVSLTMKAAIDGAVATKYKEAGNEVDVRVKLRELERENLTKLGELLVFSDSLRVAVPVKDIANIKLGYGPSEIKRKDQIRTITITAAIAKNYQEKKVLKQVAQALNDIDRPQNAEIKLVGKAREVKEAFRLVTYAIILALILNYMIMAAQFESFLQPFVIMLAVPLAIIGVAIALLVTGTSLSVISLLGILIIAGSGTNSGIILIDFINQQRMEGIPLIRAAIQAAFIRFRPILMSAVTSFAGIVPLALGLGEGAELQSPLAIAMAGGIVSGTILTLCVIPAIYVLMIRLVEHVLEGGEAPDDALTV